MKKNRRHARLLGNRGGFMVAAALLLLCGPLRAETALRVSDNRLFIPIEVNGVRTEALLDSGAEMTLLDSRFSSAVGLATAGDAMARGTGGEQSVTFASGVTVRAVGIELRDRSVAVLDLGDIAARLVGEPVDAILGRELFDAARLHVSIADGTIEVVDPAAPVNGVPLLLTDHAGIKQLPVSVGGVEVAADFDLGNGSNVLIGAAFARAQGYLDAGDVVAVETGGGIGGEIEREVVILPVLEVAGRTFTNVLASVDASSSATSLNVGVAILRHFDITTDFQQNRIWLQPLIREP